MPFKCKYFECAWQRCQSGLWRSGHQDTIVNIHTARLSCCLTTVVKEPTKMQHDWIFSQYLICLNYQISTVSCSKMSLRSAQYPPLQPRSSSVVDIQYGNNIIECSAQILIPTFIYLFIVYIFGQITAFDIWHKQVPLSTRVYTVPRPSISIISQRSPVSF